MDKPHLEIAIAGEGVTPDEVSVAELGALLQALSQLLDAIQKDAGAKLSLIAVTTGSAAYQLAPLGSDNGEAEELIRTTYNVFKTRGAGHSPLVRAKLTKVHESLRRGAIRVAAKGAGYGEPIIAAAPLAEVPGAPILASTSLFGSVVGVEMKRGGCVVTIRPDSGAKLEMLADESDAIIAGRLFNRRVQVSARYQWDGAEERTGWQMRSIASAPKVDFADAMDEMSRAMESAGVDLSELLEKVEAAREEERNS